MVIFISIKKEKLPPSREELEGQTRLAGWFAYFSVSLKTPPYTGHILSWGDPSPASRVSL